MVKTISIKVEYHLAYCKEAKNDNFIIFFFLNNINKTESIEKNITKEKYDFINISI